MEKGKSKRFSSQVFKKTFLPSLITVVFLAGYVFYVVQYKTGLRQEMHRWIQRVSFTLMALSIGFLFQRICASAFEWYRVNVAEKTESPLDDAFVPLFRRITTTIIWIFVLIAVLSRFGVNINALVATMGVSSLAIALAAQDTIANIISGFLLMIDRPFSIGDKIKLPSGEIVEVLKIGIRRSEFISDEGSVIILPNVDISKSKIINFTYSKRTEK